MLAKEKENQPNKTISSKKAKTNQIFGKKSKQKKRKTIERAEMCRYFPSIFTTFRQRKSEKKKVKRKSEKKK